MQDLRQTPQFAQHLKSLGWQVSRCSVTQEKPYMFLRKLPLIGIIVKLQRPEGEIKFDQIQKLIDKYKISAFYIEPKIPTSPNLKNTKFGYSKFSFLPAKTIIVDLAKSEDELLKSMKPKTRYNIKIAQKRGVVVRKSEDINTFFKLWKSQAFKRGMFLPQKKEICGLFKSFGRNCLLLVAYKDETPIGGILLALSSDTAFYMYAGSTSGGKKLFAPTLLAWEAIKLSRKRKLKYFDFEGIYDERYPQTKSWIGFTKFKEGFGGKVVEYPRTIAYFKNLLIKFLSV